jgi:hypothetical protein
MKWKVDRRRLDGNIVIPKDLENQNPQVKDNKLVLLRNITCQNRELQ